MRASDEGGLWAWSLERYGRDGVEAAAIKLQDEFQLNLNLLLWACWCAERYDTLPELVIRKAADLIEHWSRDVTTPLRSARRALKTPPAQANNTLSTELRAVVKEAELSAEQIEQSILEELAKDNLAETPASDPQAVARRNLAVYASLAGAQKKAGFSVYLLESLIDLILPPDEVPKTGSGETT